jgi:integrase
MYVTSLRRKMYAMAILVYCAKCDRYLSRKHETCPQCGTNLSKSNKFRINLVKPDGTRVTQVVEKNLTFARRVEAKLKTDIGNEKHLGIRKAPLMSDVWEIYLKSIRKSKKSWRDDESRWRCHIEKAVEGKRMNQLYPKDIQFILDGMVKYNSGFATKDTKDQSGKINDVRIDEENPTHAPATIKQVLALIKRLYNWSIKQGLYSGANPANNIDPPKIDNAKTACLTDAEIKALLNTINTWDNKRAALVIKFALYTGMRLDEVIGLEWKDTDTEKAFVKLVDPKGKQATIPISQKAVDILKEAKTLLPNENCPFVFPNKDGGRRVSFGKIWGRIRKKAGIDKSFRFHDLRHTFASHLASSGEVDLFTLQKLLNHQTPSMTQRYAHLLDAALRKGANVADKVFG